MRDKDCFITELSTVTEICITRFRLFTTAEPVIVLKTIYDSYIGKRHRNSHSLLIRHEPERNSLFFDKKQFACDCHWTNCIDCIECVRGIRRFYHYCRCHHTATLLLGDVELDGNALSILRRAQFIDYKLGITLIPHHGADSEDIRWLDNEICSHKNCDSILAISYGNGNKYGHPKFLYDGTIADLHSRLIFVNEK